MKRSRTILASILWLLIAIAMAVSAQAGQKKAGVDKRPSAGRGDIRHHQGRGWRGYGHRGSGRGYGYRPWGRVYEQRPFGFCPPPCARK
jgi:hypothetical protein